MGHIDQVVGGYFYDLSKETLNLKKILTAIDLRPKCQACAEFRNFLF